MNRRDEYDSTRASGSEYDLTRASGPEYDLTRASGSDDVLRDRETQTTTDGETEQQVTEIRESIEQTRAEMSETIGELQERLSPSYLKQQVKEQVMEQYEHAKETVRDATIGRVEDMVGRVGDTMYDTRRTVVDTIKANPIPAAMAGIGLAWLWMNGRATSWDSRRYGSHGIEDEMSRRYPRGASANRGSSGGGGWYGTSDPQWNQGRDSRYGEASESGGNLAQKAGDAVSGMANQVQQTASQLAGQAKATVSGMVGQAQQTAGQWMDTAEYQARQVEDRINGALRENPLAVGVVALAVGAAVGLAIPQTRKENEWLGEARDTLMEKAQSAAHDAMGQVQQVAQRVTDEMSGSESQGTDRRQSEPGGSRDGQGSHGTGQQGQPGSAGTMGD